MFIGIDLGTSGCRAMVIDAQARLIGQARIDGPAASFSTGTGGANPAVWWTSVLNLLDQLSQQIATQQVQAIAVDGTSATLLLTDAQGTPLGNALMYNDASSTLEAQRIQAVMPAHSPARSVTSSLAKLLHLWARYPKARHALHQADWISNRLSGRYGMSDENNCLKLGYDAQHQEWAPELKALSVPEYLLPQVLPPGTAYATLQASLAQRWGFPGDTQIVTGTTDSTAAFLATGAQYTGDAVTALGSTLVLKILSESPIYAPEYGIYSHRLGARWLVGGASNSGGAVFLQHFSREQLAAMTPQLNPKQPTGLDYYPLLAPGERFPVADPDWLPRLTPRPDSDVAFFQAMLEGVANIEQQGYARLCELGAAPLNTLRTTGGGAHNPAWQCIREARLAAPFLPAQHTEAAYGAALLARQGVNCGESLAPIK